MSQGIAFTIGPSVNFNPNIGLNAILKDFNNLTGTTEKFGLKTYSFGVSGTIDGNVGGAYLSYFNFHYETSSNEGFYEDSLHSYDYSSRRVFTSFGALNLTLLSSSGWFLKCELLSMGRQKMRLTIGHTDKTAPLFNEANHKAIWTTTLIPVWTPGIGLGRDMGPLRVYVGARAVVPRTKHELPGLLGLNNAEYSSRIGYFSLSLHVQLKIGG